MEKIGGIYQTGLMEVIRNNAAALRRMRQIMDGGTKPPRYCVTDAMKQRWKRKTLLKLVKESGIAEKINFGLMACGEEAVSEIKKMGVEIYETAYKAIAGDAM